MTDVSTADALVLSSGSGTSNGSPFMVAARVLAFGLIAATATGAAAVSPEQVIIGHEARTGTQGTGRTRSTVGSASSAALLKELREESGLTWDQIARLFGVSRRAVHHWSAGDTMNAHNHELLSKFAQIVAGLPGVTASDKRDELMKPRDGGASVYDALRREVSAGGVEINELPISLAGLLGIEID